MIAPGGDFPGCFLLSARRRGLLLLFLIGDGFIEGYLVLYGVMLQFSIRICGTAGHISHESDKLTWASDPVNRSSWRQLARRHFRAWFCTQTPTESSEHCRNHFDRWPSRKTTGLHWDSAREPASAGISRRGMVRRSGGAHAASTLTVVWKKKPALLIWCAEDPPPSRNAVWRWRLKPLGGDRQYGGDLFSE